MYRNLGILKVLQTHITLCATCTVLSIFLVKKFKRLCEKFPKLIIKFNHFNDFSSYYIDNLAHLALVFKSAAATLQLRVNSTRQGPENRTNVRTAPK